MKVNNYTTDFHSDINRGKVGETIFKRDFLEFLDIDFIDVTGCQQFQIIDTDFRAKIGNYEIKTNYKDDRQIIIEEYTNINEAYGKLSYGWLYKTKADLVVFLSKRTRVMVMIPWNDEFKDHYELIKEKYQLLKNKPTTYGNDKWQSAFRRINLGDIKGYYSMYKRIE